MKKSYSILCLASLLLASCSQEQDIQLSSQEKPAYLQVNIEPLSRATLLNDLPSECEYGIYCNDKTSKVEYHNGKSTILEPIALDKNYQRVFAYYPWDKENDYYIAEKEVVTFCVLDDIDYLWGMSTKEVNMYYPEAKIQLHHVFSYVDFIIQPNPYLEESLKKDLTISGFEIGEIPTYCTVERNGKYRIWNYESILIDCFDQSLADGAIKAGTLCCPTVDSYKTWNQHSNPIYISMYFHSQNEHAVIEIPRNKWSLEPGKKYTYYITVNGRLEAELSETVSVAPWKDGESQDLIVK